MAEVKAADDGKHDDWWVVDHGQDYNGIWWHRKNGEFNGTHRVEFDLIAPWEEPMTATEVLKRQDEAVAVMTHTLETIRRQYACAALTGIISNWGGLKHPGQSADLAFEYADAMMKAEGE